jgi:hypothetical protein
VAREYREPGTHSLILPQDPYYYFEQSLANEDKRIVPYALFLDGSVCQQIYARGITGLCFGIVVIVGLMIVTTINPKWVVVLHSLEHG